ncbi:MAG: DNA cytosine methyltransferase [Trinickia sp.]
MSYPNGRLGHPDQHRAISVREAASLQTFPRRYRFIGSLASRARQIGNAVPPQMAGAIGAHRRQVIPCAAVNVFLTPWRGFSPARHKECWFSQSVSLYKISENRCTKRRQQGPRRLSSPVPRNRIRA